MIMHEADKSGLHCIDLVQLQLHLSHAHEITGGYYEQ